MSRDRFVVTLFRSFAVMDTANVLIYRSMGVCISAAWFGKGTSIRKEAY